MVDIGGAYLNASMNTGVTVHMRLDATMSRMMSKIDRHYCQFTDNRGCIVIRFDKALHGCVESAALWYENLSATLAGLGHKKNDYEACVYNRTEGGVQCTVAFHVDNLIITSENMSMIDDLCKGLKSEYGDITRRDGPLLNYLRMSFDLSVPGEVSMSMKGYTNDVIQCGGIPGKARSPATDGLFDTRDGVELVAESTQIWFHSIVAKLWFLGKRARPDCLAALAYLATRVTRCTTDDVDKLKRLLRYIADTRDRGVVFRPGKFGIRVRVFIDAAYGVHHLASTV